MGVLLSPAPNHHRPLTTTTLHACAAKSISTWLNVKDVVSVRICARSLQLSLKVHGSYLPHFSTRLLTDRAR